jgi:S1-C subfamily serine protease
MKYLVVLMLSLSSCFSQGGGWVFNSARKSVVHTYMGPSQASGFVIRGKSGNKVLVTNAHVCKAVKDKLEIEAESGRRGMVAVKEILTFHDLCITEAPAWMPALDLAAAPPALHDNVHVVGHPAGEPVTLSSGQYRGEQDIKIPDFDKPGCDGALAIFGILPDTCFDSFHVYNISNVIKGGNSGSPLLNDAGDAVGVVFAGSDSMGAAVPYADLAKALSFY